MTKGVSLTSMQRANLTLLLLVRDAALRDPGAAVSRFGVQKHHLDSLVSRDPEELMEFVQHIGDQPLFLPRSDLPSLLTLPAGTAAIFASARPAPTGAVGSSEP